MFVSFAAHFMDYTFKHGITSEKEKKKGLLQFNIEIKHNLNNK